MFKQDQIRSASVSFQIILSEQESTARVEGCLKQRACALPPFSQDHSLLLPPQHSSRVKEGKTQSSHYTTKPQPHHKRGLPGIEPGTCCSLGRAQHPRRKAPGHTPLSTFGFLLYNNAELVILELPGARRIQLSALQGSVVLR